jgi:hypothetical protein
MEEKLRTEEVITQEYTHSAALLGDKVFTQMRLQAEIQSLQAKMARLLKERSEQIEPLD